MAKAGRLAKESMVRELTKELEQRSNFFVASVGPLQATEADALRKRLRGVQARVLVVKRTLGLRGMSGIQPSAGTDDLFSGSVALVFPGEDLIPAAKLLVDFAKASQDKLVVRGGWVEGQLLDQKRLQEVANLPSKLQLIAQLIGLLESPMADVVFTIERVLGDVAWVVEEASKSVKPVMPVKPVEKPPTTELADPTGSTGQTGPTGSTESQQEGKTDG